MEPEEHSMVHAEDFIIQKVKEDRNLIILAMGAMTNLAMAFLKEPALMREVRIIGMGGSFLNSGGEHTLRPGSGVHCHGTVGPAYHDGAGCDQIPEDG